MEEILIMLFRCLGFVLGVITYFYIDSLIWNYKFNRQRYCKKPNIHTITYYSSLTPKCNK